MITLVLVLRHSIENCSSILKGVKIALKVIIFDSIRLVAPNHELLLSSTVITPVISIEDPFLEIKPLSCIAQCNTAFSNFTLQNRGPADRRQMSAYLRGRRKRGGRKGEEV